MNFAPRDCYSLGRTHEAELTLKCGHTFARTSQLHEDQSLASFLFEQIIKQWMNRNKGLPIRDFDILCAICQKPTKFSQLEQITLTWNNHLEYV